MCTNESHAHIKSDPQRWAAEVEPIGEIDDGAGHVVILANCRACHSTIALLGGGQIGECSDKGQ